MQIGLDTFTLHPYSWSDPMRFLQFAREHELEGVQLGNVRHLNAALDHGALRELRAEALAQGLYCHASVSSPNPFLPKPPAKAEEVVRLLEEEITAAAAAGWRELHSVMGGLDERLNHAVPWNEHLQATMQVLRALTPVLRHHDCRINFEDHGDATTYELVRLVEEIGPDVAGICLDTANVLCSGEDPLLAARRAAPYTHLTHAKDAIVYLSDRGFTRQGRPPGEGVVPWQELMPLLAHFEPNLSLSIEDHKWVWEFPVYEEAWLAKHPDLTRQELGRVLQTAWQCHKKILEGKLPDPVAYEAIPFEQQLVKRLHAGRDHLKTLRRELGLDPNAPADGKKHPRTRKTPAKTP